MDLTIPGYRIERLIGSGGMGIVYLAVQERVKRPVAIKILSDTLSCDPELRRRFAAEAELMASLSHPGVVLLYDFMEHGDTLALIMEYIEGQTLDHMIGSEVGPIPAERAIPLFTQILDAVGYAHSKGIVHRDLKPSNIIVTPEHRTKVTDFGIAKIAGQKGLTKTGMKVGTLCYMAPEVVQGEEASYQSDIYSLGVTLYEMLAGQLPYASETSEFRIMQKIVSDELPDPREFYPHIPEHLVRAVRTSTAKEQSQRFQSCREFVTALVGTAVLPEIQFSISTAPSRTPIVAASVEPLKQRSSIVAHGLPVLNGPLPGMVFAKIPAGSFMMGSPNGEEGRFGNEGPVHRVTLNSFELMTTPVTQGMWQELMGKNPSHFKGRDNPVEQVNWKNCQEFVKKLCGRDRSFTYRLPSEAEWEYACRAGTTTTYYWGDSMNGSYCWFGENSGGATHPVGQKLPNAWGLYDMSGNVYEWCQDWYRYSYTGAPTDGSAGGSWISSDRVFRGGCWRSDARRCRSAIRNYCAPGFSGYRGLRLARETVSNREITECNRSDMTAASGKANGVDDVDKYIQRVKEQVSLSALPNAAAIAIEGLEKHPDDALLLIFVDKFKRMGLVPMNHRSGSQR